MHHLKFNSVIILLATACSLTGCAAVDGNFKTVEKNQLYRSGQLTGDLLQRRIQMHDIKTVISMRSESPDERWYQNEIAVCEANDVTHISMDWTKTRIPEPESLKKLLAALDELPKPILVHCQGGVHRSAIASAVYHLNQGTDLDTAREEIGIFFWKAPIGDFLDLVPPGETNFGQWVIQDYPAAYAGYYEK